jgi:hypothetical protein
MEMTNEPKPVPPSSAPDSEPNRKPGSHPRSSHLPQHDLMLTRTELETLMGGSLPDRVELWPQITLKYEVDGTVLPQGYSGLRARRVLPPGGGEGEGNDEVRGQEAESSTSCWQAA